MVLHPELFFFFPKLLFLLRKARLPQTCIGEMKYQAYQVTRPSDSLKRPALHTLDE